jgi:hypothetical protein
LTRQLGLNKSDIDDILNRNIEESKISTTTSDIYKGGNHYGTISIKEIF